MKDIDTNDTVAAVGTRVAALAYPLLYVFGFSTLTPGRTGEEMKGEEREEKRKRRCEERERERE